MKIFFLLNPSRFTRMNALRDAASQIAHRYGHTARFGGIDRRHARSTEDLVSQALDEGCSRIVAIGGDGTFNRLIRVLERKKRLDKTEIGLVPAGTCNDFLRFFRLTPRRLTEALRLACTGSPKPTDLCEMNGELFLNNAGFGRRSGGPSRRKVNAFRTLQQFRPIPLRCTWDGGSIEGPFFMGLICNAPFFSHGLHFSRQPRVDDGLLDVFLVPRMPKTRLAAMLLLGRLGRPLRSRQLVTLRLERFDIDAGRDLWPQLDGEPPASAPVRQLRFRVSPAKAFIIRPA